MPRFLKVEPNSPAWLKCRVGLITASRLKDVLDYTQKGKPSAKRKGYLMELVAERLTGRATEHYVSYAMDHGTAIEPLARAAYEVAFDVETDRIGFALHPTLNFTGASPDSLVGDDGGLEIKGPETTTHLDWMVADVVPPEHVPQMMWNMVCCERKWWDFLSYDDRIEDPTLQTFIKRLEYDQKLVDQYTAEVLKFEAEINAVIDQVRGNRTPVKEKFRQSVEIDAAMYITDDDLPQWAREMRS